MDLSQYSTVFCDSKQALEKLYQDGLPRQATIWTSSPALLQEDNKHIKHIEARWTVEEMRAFQNSTEGFIKQVFDSAIENFDRDYALTIAHTMVRFNRIIFKAACLTSADLVERRLFVELDSLGDSRGRFLNAPWKDLLGKSKNFSIYKYNLKTNWSSLTVKGVPLFKRLYIAGLETVFFRIATGKYVGLFQKILFDIFKYKKRQVLMPNENELLIETSSNLFKSGVILKKISVYMNDKDVMKSNICSPPPIAVIDLLRSRLKLWVVPELIDICLDIFRKEFQQSLNEVLNYKKLWINKLNFPKDMKSVLFINAPSTLSGIALTSECRKKKIPVVGFQHGVTKEICKTHGEMMIGYETNYSDLVVSYNDFSSEVSNKSFFSIGSSISVGMSNRHLRMRSGQWGDGIQALEPIVYVSTNLYKGNIGLFGTYLTDYHRSINEIKLISEVFAHIPHKVLYKTYPEHYRRYADEDPVIGEVLSSKNIELFGQKTDMRYSVSKYRVFVTSKATSTLGWLVMSGKPVVFINWSDNMPLTDEAYKLIKKGLFLFDGSSKDAFKSMMVFLSKPIEEIERLWEEKSNYREDMIKHLFSSHQSNAGKRAASLIKKNFFN
jgi:hypothetical protein